MDNPVWKPAHPEQSRMWAFMRYVEDKFQFPCKQYQQLHDWSVQNPVFFWQAICDFFDIRFSSPAKAVLNNYEDMLAARWFNGATLNFAEKLLSRRDEHIALIAINENGDREFLTYAALYQAVARCAQGLREAGVKTGDRVAAVMPNVAMTIIAMLATTSLGAIWSSCSPDFGAQAAIDRLGQVEPKILFICDGHQYLGKKHDGYDKITELAKTIASLEQIVICPILNISPQFALPEKAILWENFLKPAQTCEFKQLAFEHPIYILFSSGTTGKPKCIVHGAGGTLLQHIKELALHCDISDQDNLCFYTTCGWMMWNWMISVLALGATLTLYEGAPTYPDANRLFELIESEKITLFGTSAKFISAVEKAGVIPKEKFGLAKLRTILSTGSPLLPKNYDFVYENIKTDVQLSSISGGTDIVSCFALGNPILPVYRGELQGLGLGMAVDVYNEEGKSVRAGRGELVCTKSFPSMPVFFWNDLDKKAYRHAYFERFTNVWAHGDFAEITKHNGLIIYGRSDAVLNPGGVRIGTAEIYRQVEKIPEVVDSVVIGQEWQEDTRIVLFVQLREGMQLDKPLKDKICHTIRHNTSPRHTPAKILQVSDIPRTMSGKVVELAVRQIVHGQTINNTQSIANPQVLNEFKDRQELLEP